MNAAVGGVFDREERKAYVRFEMVAEEDLVASKTEGRYISKDVEYAKITPPYSKDCVVQKVVTWLAQMEENVRNDRLPRKWADEYLAQLAAWRKGQELPPEGTAIRGWSMISPAQQENCIRVNILTVEDLAGVNDTGARMLGMGSLDLKNKAIAWLAQAKDKGPLTIEVTALKRDREIDRATIETLKEQVKQLMAAKPEKK